MIKNLFISFLLPVRRSVLLGEVWGESFCSIANFVLASRQSPDCHKIFLLPSTDFKHLVADGHLR
jgi:hypothetical protein